MRKLDAVAINKVNSYFTKNGSAYLNIVELLQTINTGKAKYNYFDLLDYLISASIKILESNPNNLKRLDKYITLIDQIASVDRGNFEHDEVTISRYVALPDALVKYYEGRGEEVDKSLYDSIFHIGENLGVTFDESPKDDRLSTKVVELAEEVERLKGENSSLSRQLEDVLKQLKKANSSSDTLKASMDTQVKNDLLRINELERKIKELQGKIDSLDASDKEKEQKIKVLDGLIQEKEKTISELRDKLNAVTKSRDDLSKSYQQVLVSEPYIIGRNALKDERIDNIILDLISKKRYTVSEIMSVTKLEIPDIKLQDIYASLRRISFRYNIQNPKMITVPETYGITKPILPEDKTIVLPTDGEVKKLIMLSDLHITPDADLSYLFSKMGYLYDYAAGNGIDTIVDLGDLFETDGRNFSGAMKPQTAYKKVESLAENLNSVGFFDPNFNYIVLGGNHDTTVSEYGFDPFKVLKEANPNVIPVGYHNASLKIGNNRIGLHHEGAPRQDLFNTKEFTQKVMNFLRVYYAGKEKAFFDFFGHIHTSVIDSANGYACVPSFDRDRNFDGMLELDVYLNKSGDIDYMVIYPLASSYNKEVRKTSEIPIVR